MATPEYHTFYHRPALINEVMAALELQPGDCAVDATLGDAGHALRMLEATAPSGRLLGIDADAQALERARQRLRSFADRVLLVNGNFADLRKIVSVRDFPPPAGILFDLGLSSWQLRGAGRGFSFSDDTSLDMRLGSDQSTTAMDVVNAWGLDDLMKIIWGYGEEPRSRRIAQAIVQRRPINTASELAQIIEGVVPRRGRRIHPATRTFQAIRIAVNHELENLESALQQTVGVVGKGGRVVVIAYHSLEDRVVKAFMRRESKDCICPAGTPECACGHEATIRLLRKKVVKPSAEEVRENPRARSAKLRACVVI